MTEVFNNYAPITLAAPCLAGDASITVSDPAALSAVGNYRLIIDTEIMLATSRSGAVVSVTRAMEGTAAAGHAAGALVQPGVTAGALGQLKIDVLTNPSVFGISKFGPTTLAPASTASVPAALLTGQTTAIAHTNVIVATIPLPGTIGAPCATGMLEIDCEVSLMSTTTTDAARFKLTWQWSVQTPGAPVALGSLVTSLSVGSNGGAPPAGWTAALALDGGSTNAQIVVSGDAALTVTAKALVQWGYTQ